MDDQSDGKLEQALTAWAASSRNQVGAAPAFRTSEPLRRPGWQSWAAVAAAAASVATVVVIVSLFAGSDDTQHALIADNATSTVDTAREPEALPSDDGLMLTARSELSAPLTQRQAEAIMLNSSPTPPLGDSALQRPRENPVEVSLASVRLDPAVRRLRGDLPVDLPLAWVAVWQTQDGPAACPDGKDQGYDPEDTTQVLHAYVLAADGSLAYSYNGGSSSCLTRRNVASLAEPTAQRAYNAVSVAWTGDTRNADGDVVMKFEGPSCSEPLGLVDDSNQQITLVETPVGQACGGVKQHSFRTGPVAPKHHPLLGPVRFINGQMRPALAIPVE